MTVLRFSTSAVAPEQRQAVAEEVYGAHVRGQLDFEQDHPIAVDIRARELSGLHFAAITTSPVRATHGADENGMVYLGMGVSGTGALGNGDVVRLGHVNIVRRDKADTTVVATTSTILSFAIPRTALAGRLLDLDDLLGHSLAPTAASRLLEAYAGSLLAEVKPVPAPDAAVMAEHVVDLVCLALGAGRDSAQLAQGSLRAARLHALKKDISAHAADPELSPAWLARRHQLSESYIRALFYDAGTSFTEHLLNTRLDNVRRLLADPRLMQRNIASLALDAGFGDISWFNQVFRRRFGLTPSEMRRLGQG